MSGGMRQATTPVHCYRCERKSRNYAGWNIEFDNGHAVGFLCPNCQTPEENAEAVINEATIDYSNLTWQRKNGGE